LPPNTGALEATVVTLAGKDYLYVICITAYVISGYQLYAAGNAVANTIVVAQQGDTSNLPRLIGIAAFVQTQSSSSSATSLFTSTITIVIYIVFIYFGCE
jgi:hypothetical protein